jgi:hypothetical protein
MRKSFKFSLPFPVVKLDVLIKYTAVRKASGVGYIILTLIHDSKDKQTRLAALLESFGIHPSAHFIFAREIYSLLSSGYLKMVGVASYADAGFENYTLSDFAFTNVGERQFKEGYVPTGEEKVKPATVYYNPLDEEFSLEPIPKTKEIEKFNCFPASFIQGLKIDDQELQDWVLSVQNDIGLRREERITKYSINSRQGLAVRYDNCAEFVFESKDMSVDFGLRGSAAFYQKHYSEAILKTELQENCSFPFETQVFKEGIPDARNLNNIYSPSEYDKLKRTAAALIVESVNNEFNVNFDKTSMSILKVNLNFKQLDNFTALQVFLVIGERDARFYLPGKFTFHERTMDKSIEIQLLLENVYDESIRSVLLENIKNAAVGLVEQSEDEIDKIDEIYKLIEKCSMLSGKPWAFDFLKSRLLGGADRIEKIKCISRGMRFFTGQTVHDFIKKISLEEYSAIIKTLNREDGSGSIFLLKNLLQPAGITIEQMIRDVSKRLEQEGKTTIAEIFDFMVTSDIEEQKVLAEVNLVSFYLKNILDDNRALPESRFSAYTDICALGNNLFALKDVLGIKSLKNYVIPENYDTQRFVDTFRTFQTQCLKIKKKYNNYAPDQFQALEEYIEIFSEPYKYIMREREAEKSPQTITGEIINQEIDKGQFTSAIAHLAVKIEYILKSRYSLSGKLIMLGKLIEKTRADNNIPPDVCDSLYKVNELRINKVHFTSKMVNIDPEKLKEYARLIFGYFK